MSYADDIGDDLSILLDELGREVVFTYVTIATGPDPMSTAVRQTITAAFGSIRKNFPAQTVEAGDAMVLALGRDFVREPRTGDQVTDVDGKTWQVIACSPKYVLGSPVWYRIQVRG